MSKKGFAALSPEKRREISRLGGLRVQALKTGHRFTSEEAQKAGRLGGLATAQKIQQRKEVKVLVNDSKDKLSRA